MQELPHGLPFDALRLLGFRGGFVAGTHELLTRMTGHAFPLRIAVCHSLLLRVDLGAGLAEGKDRLGRDPLNEGSDLGRL
jgi:hypothetical protein